jgi:hypothetical protein
LRFSIAGLGSLRARSFLGGGGLLLALELELLLDGFALRALGRDGIDGGEGLGFDFCCWEGRCEFCLLSALA